MVFFGWLGVRHVLAGGVLLAMQITDFSIVFSPTALGVTFLAALSLSSFSSLFSSAVKSGVGMLLWVVGSWETERCVDWGVGWRWLVFVMLGGVLGVCSEVCLWLERGQSLQWDEAPRWVDVWCMAWMMTLLKFT